MGGRRGGRGAGSGREKGREGRRGKRERGGVEVGREWKEKNRR